MSTSGNVQALAFDAAVALNHAQYHIMGISNGAQSVNITTAATASKMLGILQNAPSAAGHHATVGWSGKSKVVAGAAVNSVGVFLTSNASGRAIAAASGDMTFGRSLETAGADGDVMSALIFPPVRLSGAI